LPFGGESSFDGVLGSGAGAGLALPSGGVTLALPTAACSGGAAGEDFDGFRRRRWRQPLSTGAVAAAPEVARAA
jgi:hypothetical protein